MEAYNTKGKGQNQLPNADAYELPAESTGADVEPRNDNRPYRT
jgi:hypothetical protein